MGCHLDLSLNHGAELCAMTQRVSCTRCKHFYITWNKRRPYGCRRWNVIAAQHPCVAVLAASGMPCHLYEPKSGTKPEK